jgi:hypothetical protein
LAQTLNISSTGATNKIGTHATTYFTGPTSVTSHVISGDKAFSYVLAAADGAALKSIDASTSTGGVSANVAAATGGLSQSTFTFTGGSGNDTIIFANNQIDTLTAGTQLKGGRRHGRQDRSLRYGLGNNRGSPRSMPPRASRSWA